MEGQFHLQFGSGLVRWEQARPPLRNFSFAFPLPLPSDAVISTSSSLLKKSKIKVFCPTSATTTGSSKDRRFLKKPQNMF